MLAHPRKEVSREGAATIKRKLLQGCSKGLLVGLDRDPEGELDRQASNSPVPGEGRKPEQPDQHANAMASCG
jgi:hypothetical protein